MAVYAFCCIAFLADLTNDISLAFGVFYIPLVSTAIYHRDPRAPWWLAALASAMVALGFIFPVIPPDVITALSNRGLSIVAILITAYLIDHERRIRDQLADQTARAEAADRVKTQLFNSLSHELRTPLSAILGFVDLLIPDARPDQHMALGYIQSGGRRLRATLENLIDLTHLDVQKLRIRRLDLAALLRPAIEANRALAVEKRIALTLTTPDTKPLSVMGDSWALRRIIDNLLANGIKFTDPGGTVELAVQRMQNAVVMIITDTGAGMPPDVLEQIGAPFFQGESGAARRFEGMGTGLALSLRLADAMGATLRFDSTPGHGTEASLTLPSPVA